MISFRMSWFLAMVILCLTLLDISHGISAEAKHDETERKKKLPSAVVVGTVYCDTCFQDVFSKPTHFISGALVAVECGGRGLEPSFRREVKTDEHGEFRVGLPFSVSKHLKRIKGCCVNLIRSGEPYCTVASAATSSSLHLKSRKQGPHIFSAGFFTFRPLKQPTLCSQKPSVHQSPYRFSYLKSSDPSPSQFDPNFPAPIQDPPMPFLPPIDGDHPLPALPNLPNPLPALPNLPNLPPLLPLLPPLLPPLPPRSKPLEPSEVAVRVPKEKVATPQDLFNPSPQIPLLPSPPSLLPPNPFQPPPSLLPPNPFQPSPPSLLPPNPFQPSPPPLINLPPLIPGLIPSTPPPVFPIPLPPVPFQPSPGIPGIPPAASSTKKTSHP